MTTVDVDKKREDVLANVTDCVRSKETATDDFIQAVLDASAAGISQRVIGEAAGLSHARIGQIVREYRRTNDWS